MLDATVWNQFGQLVIANTDAVAGADAVEVRRNGRFVTEADQLVFSRDVGGLDFRQNLVSDSNGVFRLRHLDGDRPPRGDAPCTDTTREDCFGTSLRLGPGLIRQPGDDASDFFLSAKVNRFNLITKQARRGTLKLVMTGSPANGLGQLAPVSVKWTMTIFAPTNDVAQVRLQTRAKFTATFQLSTTHLANAEAFRAASFSSSNNTTATGEFPSGTHDADQLRLIAASGNIRADVNLTTAPRGDLFLPGSGSREGVVLDGAIQLNQVNESPLNGDPPNITIELVSTRRQPEYRGQGFISDTTDHNDDNLGVWLSRSFANSTIRRGTRLTWNFDFTATDAILNPPL